MLREIHLHGTLGQRFGRRHRLDVQSAAEAVRALCLQLPTFRHVIEDGEWRIVRAQDHRISRGEPLEAAALPMRLGRAGHLHIAPAIKGRGRGGGTAKIVVGAILVIAAVFTFGQSLWATPAVAGAAVTSEGVAASGIGVGSLSAGGTAGATAGAGASAGVLGSGISATTVGLLGVSMILSGVSMLIAPHRPTPVDANPSYALTGATNTFQEGQPVPLVYGRVRVGSVVAATSLEINDYDANAIATTPTGLLFGQTS